MFVSLIISCDVCLKSFPLITIWYPISAALSFIYQNLGVSSEPDDNVPYDVCVLDHIQWWSQNISLDHHAVWSHISIWYHVIPYDTTYPISGALTFMVLAAALVTASFLMSPVIEDVFGNVFYTRQRKFSSNEDEKYFQCTARWTIQVLMLQTTLVILPGKS